MSWSQRTWLGVVTLGLGVPAGCGQSASQSQSEVGPLDAQSGLADNAAEISGKTRIPPTVPDFSAATFTNPTQIDNPYFSAAPGMTWTYVGQTPDGTEQTVVEVLEDTHEVLDITCRVVRDRVSLNDVLIEDTHDFFAQDDAGNVWYMGETVDNYNYDAEGNLIDITHEGAWQAGLDVADRGRIASPGHIMRASPTPEDIYHQEWYRQEAEDMAEVEALNVPVTLANGTIYSCLQTLDFTRLDPHGDEYKYYAAGIGPLVTEHIDGSERAELVSFEP